MMVALVANWLAFDIVLVVETENEAENANAEERQIVMNTEGALVRMIQREEKEKKKEQTQEKRKMRQKMEEKDRLRGKAMRRIEEGNAVEWWKREQEEMRKRIKGRNRMRKKGKLPVEGSAAEQWRREEGRKP